VAILSPVKHFVCRSIGRDRETRGRNRTAIIHNPGAKRHDRSTATSSEVVDLIGGGAWTRTTDLRIMSPKARGENTLVAGLNLAERGKVRQDAQPRRNCEGYGGFRECSFIAVESENIWANRESFLLAPRRHASQSGRYPFGSEPHLYGRLRRPTSDSARYLIREPLSSIAEKLSAFWICTDSSQRCCERSSYRRT
jgi:hypothetical protein